MFAFPAPLTSTVSAEVAFPEKAPENVVAVTTPALPNFILLPTSN